MITKITHFVFEKGKNPKKYLEDKITEKTSRPVNITFVEIFREVMRSECDSKNL